MEGGRGGERDKGARKERGRDYEQYLVVYVLSRSTAALFFFSVSICLAVMFLCSTPLPRLISLRPLKNARSRSFLVFALAVSPVKLLLSRDMSELPMHTFKAKAPYTGTVETVEKLVQPGASGEVRTKTRLLLLGEVFVGRVRNNRASTEAFITSMEAKTTTMEEASIICDESVGDR